MASPIPMGTPMMVDRCFCTGSSVVDVGGASVGEEVGEGAARDEIYISVVDCKAP